MFQFLHKRWFKIFFSAWSSLNRILIVTQSSLIHKFCIISCKYTQIANQLIVKLYNTNTNNRLYGYMDLCSYHKTSMEINFWGLGNDYFDKWNRFLMWILIRKSKELNFEFIKSSTFSRVFNNSMATFIQHFSSIIHYYCRVLWQASNHQRSFKS